MKIIIALSFLLAGISALPQQEQQGLTLTQQRLVSDAIAGAIEDVSQSIKDAGLDPLIIKRESASYELPVPVIFNGVAYVEELLSTGLSNIVINNINFGIITFRLTFDIELPLISASADAIGAEATLFGTVLGGEGSGSIAIRSIRVTGQARVNVGLISGISVRDLRINFTLGGIDSNLNVVIQGRDISNTLNTFLGTTIPNTLDAYSSEINELLVIVVQGIIDDAL